VKINHRKTLTNLLPTESEMDSQTYYYATNLMLAITEMQIEEELNLSAMHNALLLNLAEVERRLSVMEGNIH
jgi:hypothetical protein